MIYRFQGFELDAEGFVLRYEGKPVDVQPKTLDLLAYLVRNRHRVVTRRELLEALWPGSVVTANALTRTVSQARAALGEAAAGPRAIRTVPRRGYQFVARVESLAEEAATGAPGRTPFVGREASLAALRAELDRALAGSTRLVLLSGEAGIGKSRLVQELASEARRRGAEVLEGRAYEGEAAPPYWAWVQILRRFLRGRSAHELRADLGSGAAALAQLSAEHASALSDLPPPPPLEPAAARFRLWDAVATATVRSAARAPMVLVFEDLHGIDPSSLGLLEFLLREVSEAPLLVMATYQAERTPAQGPLAEALERLGRGVAPRRIALEGLATEEVAAFVRARTGEEPDRERTRALERRTGGNPLFLEALTAASASGSGRAPEPPALRDAVRSRVRATAPETRELLALASVLGTEFDRDALLRASGLPAEEALRRLEEAERSGLVRRLAGEGPRLRFAHGLIQEALYADAGVAERVRRHWRVGEAMAAAGPGAHASAEIAHHLCEGAPTGDPDRAIRAALQAAEDAAHALALDEAVRFHRRALDVLGLKREVESRERGELLLALGLAERRAGRFAEAASTFEAASAIARRTGSPELLARAALGASDPEPTVSGPRRDAIARLEEALARLGEGHPCMRSRLLSRLARFLGAGGARPRAELCAREAAALARAQDDVAALGEALDAWNAAIEGMPERAEERWTRAAEVLRCASVLPDPALGVAAQLRRAAAYLERGRLDAVREALAEAGARAGDARASTAAWRLALAQALLALLDGDLAEAKRRMRAARAAGKAIRHPDVEIAYAVQSVQLRYHEGRLGELASGLGRLESIESHLGEMASLRAARAWALCEAGRLDEARPIFESLAERDFAGVRRRAPRLGLLGALARVAHALGDAPRAEALYGILEPHRDHVIQVGLVVCGGSAAHPLALLAEAAGRPALALREAQRAVAANAAMGARLWEAHARAHLSRLHEAAASTRAPRRAQRARGTPSGEGDPEVSGRPAASEAERSASAPGAPSLHRL